MKAGEFDTLSGFSLMVFLEIPDTWISFNRFSEGAIVGVFVGSRQNN